MHRLSLLLLIGCLGVAFIPLAGRKSPKTARTDAGPAREEVLTDLYGDPLPDGAIARLGTIRLRHSEHIDELIFAPKGNFLASISSGATRLWDTRTGKLLRQLPEPVRPECLVFSPDGQYLIVSPGEGSIRIEAAESGKEIRRLAVDKESYTCIACSPNGQRLVGVSSDSIFTVWDLTRGDQICRIASPAGEAEGMRWQVALRDDGRLLACGGPGSLGFWRPKIVSCWDVTTGRKVMEGPAPDIGVTFAAFASDGESLHFGNYDFLMTCKVGSPETLRWVAASTQGTTKNRNFYGYAFSADGKVITSASHGQVQIWDAATLARVGVIDDVGGVRTLALSADGKMLASAGDQVIQVWDTTTGKRIDPFEGQEQHDYDVVFAQRPGRIISASWGRLRFWDAASGKLLTREVDHDTIGPKLTLSPDGNLVASGDYGISIYEAATGKLVHRARNSSWLEALVFSAPDRLVLAEGKRTKGVGTERWIAQCAARTGKPISHLALPVEPEPPRKRMDLFQGPHQTFRLLSADGKLGVSSNAAFNGYLPPLNLWDAARGRILHQIGGKEIGVDAVALSPDCRLLATCGALEAPLQLWETISGKERQRFSPAEWTPRSIAFSPDGRLLAAGEYHGRIKLWDLACGVELRPVTGHDESVSSLAFSPDGRFLVSGSWDTTILIWDMAKITRHRLRPIAVSDKTVAALWDDLADSDAHKAHRAIWGLVAVPGEAVAMLRRSLRPVVSAEDRMKRLIADLDSGEFAIREKATQELETMADQARPALEALLQRKPSPEARRRAEQLVEAAYLPSAPGQLRALRAIEVLELIASPEAQEVLTTLARGLPTARLTQEAKDSLERVARRLATSR
jgi:WD40 repeat protein